MASTRLDPNRNPALLGVSTVDNLTTLPVSATTLTNATALATMLVDSAGTQITSFGGGTQYTDAASTVTHPTGTMPVFDNAGTISKVSNTIGLPVNIVAGAGSGGTALTDNSAFTAGTTSATPISGFYHSTIDTVTDGRAAAVAIDINRNLMVAGGVASGATDAGNPLKVGALFSTTPATFTDGQRGNLQMGSRGSLWTTIIDKNTTTAVGFAADNADATAATSSGNKMTVLSRNTVYNGTNWDRMYGTTNGTYVHGSVASGASDAGNPVKVGGKYNASAPTLTDGQRGDAQLDVNANLKVSSATLIAGEDLTNNVLKVEQRFSYATISTATTTTIKSGAGYFHTMTVTGGAGGTIIIYDNTAASGTKIADFDLTAGLASYIFDVSFATGLTVITSAATKLSISYR